MQAKIAGRLEAEIVTKRADAQQVIDQSSEVQRQFYDLGTEIARIEESIQYQSERAQALNEDIKAGVFRGEAKAKAMRTTFYEMNSIVRSTLNEADKLHPECNMLKKASAPASAIKPATPKPNGTGLR